MLQGRLGGLEEAQDLAVERAQAVELAVLEPDLHVSEHREELFAERFAVGDVQVLQLRARSQQRQRVARYALEVRAAEALESAVSLLQESLYTGLCEFVAVGDIDVVESG